jgi:hypothetical protein
MLIELIAPALNDCALGDTDCDITFIVLIIDKIN